MKMVLIAYCEAVDYEIIDALREAGIKGYTKFTEVLGEGTETQPRLGTACWPGRNNFLAIALEDDELAALKTAVAGMKANHPRAGIKAFIMPLEEIL
ncbi:MAG: PG0541 family transporter-associated protein [Thermodesulfovibrionales bacterium]|jgi:nitrogen regulatory protein PII